MDSVRYFSKHQMTAIIFLLCNPGTSRYMVIAKSQLSSYQLESTDTESDHPDTLMSDFQPPEVCKTNYYCS